MSVSVMTWAWQLRIPSNEKIVLVALADRANDDGECWPGYASLAEKCSMSERNVMRIVASLETKNLLSITTRKDAENNRQKTNIYRLNVEQKPGDILSPGNEQKPGDKCDKSRVTPVSPNTSVNQTSVVRAGEKDSPALTNSAPSKKTDPEKPALKIEFDAERQQFVNISESQYAKWDAAYPKLDVDAELEKAELWLMANPKKRKQNYLKFINGWLGRAATTQAQPKAFSAKLAARPAF